MKADASPSLRHEHLVRINDPANAWGDWLTRQQLWQGLRHTVLAPQLLDASIDAVAVREISAGLLQREIRRGRTTLCDRVDFTEDESIVIRADEHGVFAGSHLHIQIEEPAAGMLFVRFTYELMGLDSGHTEEEDRARCDAYRASDIERIREARRHARLASLC